MNSTESGERVIIIGGGISGLSTAYYAAQKGFKPVVLDPEMAGDGGCSYGNAGMVVPSHFVPLAAPGVVWQGIKWMFDPSSPFSVKPRLDPELLRWGTIFQLHCTKKHVANTRELLRDLNLASRDRFLKLQEKLGDFGLVSKGLLMLCETEEGLEHEAAFAREAMDLGVETEVCDAERLKELDPKVDLAVNGGVYFPLDCHMDPERLMAKLKEALVELGGELHNGVEVETLIKEGDRFVAARAKDGSEFAGDHCVIAAGVKSKALAKQLGFKLPLEAGKGYSLMLKEPRQLPELCSILTEARVAVTPMGDSLRVAGTMEIGASLEKVNQAKLKGIIDSFCRYFSDFTAEDFSGIEPWSGLRPCSPDGLPYIGRAPRVKNALVASGHAMMGLSLGPITGEILANELAGDQSEFASPMLSPGRFS